MEDMIGLLSTIKDQSHENFNNKRILSWYTNNCTIIGVKVC